jgi:uncharacterized Zn finger protein
MGDEDYDGWGDYRGWRPYVSVAQRRRQAEREMQKRKKQGHAVSPVIIEGRAIVKTFWGKSWCENLEGYSDYENRLPRGRTYVRNGSVVDLQIKPGVINAWVSGSELYEISLTVAPVAKSRWKSICDDCAGAIDSLVELLQGRFSKGVVERICRQSHGLFPTPAELKLSCSCPDGAYMCKHVAAVLYGIGARFDHQPELLFRLRGVDEKELIVKAGKGLPLAKQVPAPAKVLGGDLSDIFGLDMAQSSAPKLPKKKARAAKKSAVAQKSKPQQKEKPKQAPSKQRRKRPEKLPRDLALAAGKSST